MLDLFMPTYDHRWVVRLTPVNEDIVAEAVARLVDNQAPTQWAHRYCMVAGLSRSSAPAVFMEAGMDIDSAHVAAHNLLDTALGATFFESRLSLSVIKQVAGLESEAQALTELSVLALHALEAQMNQALTMFKEYFFDEGLALNTALSLVDEFMSAPMNKPLAFADGFRRPELSAAISEVFGIA
jgi:hypothetical protein